MQQLGPDDFRTVFPSREAIEHMIEWGVVHTKFKAEMLIEERVRPKEVKAVLPKVWVQFTGIPKEMMVFPLIWAVGSILGVTKEVDMVFTAKHDVGWLQVMVLDVSLLPQYVDVVIGDCLFELHFHVEHDVDADNPSPMDMDDQGIGDKCGNNSGNGNDVKDKSVSGSVPSTSSAQHKATSPGRGTQSSGKKVVVLDVDVQAAVQMASRLCGVQETITTPVSPKSSSRPRVEIVCTAPNTPDVSALAAVSEATTGASVWSKRRVGISGDNSLERAPKLKASRNLDADYPEGTSNSPVPYLPPDVISSKLEPIGFSGNAVDGSWSGFVDSLSSSDATVNHEPSMVERAIEIEEQSFRDVEELDNIILSSLCNDILGEVADSSSEHIVLPRTGRVIVTNSSPIHPSKPSS